MRLRVLLREVFGPAEVYPLRGLYFCCGAGATLGGSQFLIFFLLHEGLSGKQAGYVASMTPFMMLLALPLWGVAADHFGRRRCLGITILSAAVLYLRMYWLHGFWLLLFNAAGVSFFIVPVGTLRDAVALDFIEANGKVTYSKLRIWGTMGFVVGSATAGLLLKGHETRSIFLWAMGWMLTGFLFSLILKTAAPKRAVDKIRLDNLGPVNRSVPFVTFLTFQVLVSVGSAPMWNFYGAYMTEIGGSVLMLGFALALQGCSAFSIYFFADAIINRLGTNRTLLIGFACTTLRLFAYSFNSNPWMAIGIELCHGVSYMLFWIASVQHVNHLIEPRWWATGQALLNASYSGAGTIVGVLWGGFLLDYFRFHFVNPWVPFPAQKLFFACGSLLAAVTVASTLVLPMLMPEAPAAPPLRPALASQGHITSGDIS